VPPLARRSTLPAQAREYVPRKPQDTLLHRLVREHLATFVAHTEATYAAPLPRYVTDSFERYLACGDFSQGFVRCHCDVCRHDVLVAFSCKQRGLCPSCGARRMCDVAAHITDVALVAQRVHDRSLVWLRRHRYLDERPAEDRSNEPAADTPIDALARLALGGGTFVSRPFAPEERARDEDLDRKEPRFSATCNGFDVHCAVRVEAGDDQRRERLVRYCARPPFALERIEVMKDGRVAYRSRRRAEARPIA
jgi:hypothetical protein